MAKPVQSFIAENIDARLEELGLSAREASLATGKGADLIRNMKRASSTNRPYNPRTDTLQLLATVLKTTPEALMSSSLPEKKGELEHPLPAFMRPLPKREDPSRRVPIFSSAEGGDGALIIDNTPIGWDARPNILEDEDDLYGVVIEGTSMVKAYRPGDTAWLHPRYRERRDEPCIFRAYNDVTGEARASIKWLNDFTSSVWKVEQFNPARSFELSRRDWPECFRVLGKKNGAGR